MDLKNPSTLQDYGIGIPAATSPAWVPLLEQGVGWFVMFGGAVLVTLRVALAYHEWKNRNKQ
jgi:hypothetical protein